MSSSLREFNLQIQNFLPFKSEESQHHLNRSISLLFSSQTIADYSPDRVENCQFYINLYKIMNILDIESEAIWKCVTILQEASKNIDARHAIVNKFKFFPLLAKILQQLVVHEKIEKMLILMQELSYGICIVWEEPYLCQLIPVLLREIDSIDGSLAYISLSVLVNISYKNFPVICLLMKTTNLTNFSEKIKPFGILANKMLIILEYNNITITDTIDIYLFIKKSFAEIEYAIKNWNIPLIRHVVEFLIDSKHHNNIHSALIEYENFESDIIGLIQSIKIRLDLNNYPIENFNLNKNQQICLGLIFDLFNYILEIINTNVNLILSQDIYQKIADFLYIWLDCKYSGENAIELLTTVVKLGNNVLISNIGLEIPIILKKLMTIAQNNEISNKLITALHKLIIGLLHRTQTTTLVLTNVTESYFDKIFSPILNIKQELLCYSELTPDELSKYLYCLLVLIEFSNISKTIWRDKMNKIFNCPQIQYVLAKGMLIENESLCNIVFEISKIDNFPQKEVAKYVSQLSELVTPTTRHISQSSFRVLHQSETTNILSPMIRHVGKDCEERLNALIDQIIKQNTNSGFEPATSELIELFHYKMDMINSKIGNLTKKLEKSAEENTELSHEISLHNSELSKFQNLNFKMHLQHERLAIEIKDLNKQKDIFKNGLEKLGRKYREERLKYKNYVKIIEAKDGELNSIRKDLLQANDKSKEYIEDIKNINITIEEKDKEIEKFKQNIVLIDKKSKEKEDLMEVNENEILKLTKNVEELRKSLEKSDNIIKHLENQIIIKDDTIRCYENELNETEEMKQTILNLMETKKSKRKLCNI